MIRFLKNRTAPPSRDAQQLSLGRLEFDLMQILWARGESNVRDVVQQLERPLAYTTVMTTLDRLYKKRFAGPADAGSGIPLFRAIFPAGMERTRAENVLTNF